MPFSSVVEQGLKPPRVLGFKTGRESLGLALLGVPLLMNLIVFAVLIMQLRNFDQEKQRAGDATARREEVAVEVAAASVIHFCILGCFHRMATGR